MTPWEIFGLSIFLTDVAIPVGYCLYDIWRLATGRLTISAQQWRRLKAWRARRAWEKWQTGIGDEGIAVPYTPPATFPSWVAILPSMVAIGGLLGAGGLLIHFLT